MGKNGKMRSKIVDRINANGAYMRHPCNQPMTQCLRQQGAITASPVRTGTRERARVRSGAGSKPSKGLATAFFAYIILVHPKNRNCSSIVCSESLLEQQCDLTSMCGRAVVQFRVMQSKLLSVRWFLSDGSVTDLMFCFCFCFSYVWYAISDPQPLVDLFFPVLLEF